MFHFYWMYVAKKQNWNVSFEPEASWERGTAYVVNVFHFGKDLMVGQEKQGGFISIACFPIYSKWTQLLW